MSLARRLLLAVALAWTSVPALAADKLTVVLDWFVNPDHAPLIIAREQGGGGHKRAAGFGTDMPYPEIVEFVRAEVAKQLD